MKFNLHMDHKSQKISPISPISVPSNRNTEPGTQNPKHMIKILLTGSSGFVGSNLYENFFNDFELYGLDINTSGKFPAEKVWEWDKLNQLPEVDAIIHLAGKAHDTENTAEEKEYFEVNLGLSQKIFDYFLQSSATKFIFFSSVKAVADSLEGEILTEDAVPNPLTPYGKSKLAAEQYILSKELSEDKRVYIIRPVMIHGPGNKGNLNLLFKVVEKGIPWPLGAYSNLRSFVSIDNVSFAIKQLIEKPVVSGIYQLADDDAVSTKELVQLIASSIHRTPTIWNLPKGLITALAKAGDTLHLPLNSGRLKKLTESYVVSNAKLKDVLRIDHMPVSATDGLKHTLKSFSQY
jgi:nucleoside-diphosphate-sugar epimerase